MPNPSHEFCGMIRAFTPEPWGPGLAPSFDHLAVDYANRIPAKPERNQTILNAFEFDSDDEDLVRITFLKIEREETEIEETEGDCAERFIQIEDADDDDG